SLLDRHPDRAGGVVDDHVVHLGLDRFSDRAEVLDLIARRPVRRAGVDVDLRAPLDDRPPGLGRVLLRRVRNRRALLAIGDRPRDGAADDRGVHEAAHQPSRFGEAALTASTRAATSELVASSSVRIAIPSLFMWRALRLTNGSENRPPGLT